MQTSTLTSFVTALTLATSSLSTAQAATPSMLTDGVARIYEIVEPTKDERVAAGSDGNILRWSSTGGDEQRWVIYPAPEKPGSYRIQNVQTGKFMAVGSNGNILLWDERNDNSQLFRFVNGRGDTFHLQEPTRNEYVSVGSWGNIERWGRAGDDTQRFTLRAVETIERPTTYQATETLPLPEDCNTVDEVFPLVTDQVLVDELILPFSDMADPSYTLKREQMYNAPYYRIQHFQYYDASKEGRGFDFVFLPNEDRERVVQTFKGFSSEHFHEVKTTVGHTFSASAEMGGSVSVPAGPATVTGDGSLKLGYDYSMQKTELERNQQTSDVGVTTTDVRTFHEGHHRKTSWALVDRYVVHRLDATGQPVGHALYEWEHVNQDLAKTTGCEAPAEVEEPEAPQTLGSNEGAALVRNPQGRTGVKRQAGTAPRASQGGRGGKGKGKKGKRNGRGQGGGNR